jgi:hypothetical protein
MKDTSFQETQKILDPKIEEINHKTQYAEYEKSSLSPIRYLAVVGDKSMERNPPGPPQMLGEHYQFLRDIADFPPDGLKVRYERMMWGPEKGNRLLNDLVKLGYVWVKKVPNSGPYGGRGRLVPVLTKSGQHALEAYEARTRPGI